jgi:hypothetical protein
MQARMPAPQEFLQYLRVKNHIFIVSKSENLYTQAVLSRVQIQKCLKT